MDNFMPEKIKTTQNEMSGCFQSMNCDLNANEYL